MKTELDSPSNWLHLSVCLLASVALGTAAPVRAAFDDNPAESAAAREPTSPPAGADSVMTPLAETPASAAVPAWNEYTNSYEGIPGRGARTLFDLPIPYAGLYQVEWRAEVYSLEPQAQLIGICSVGDDPAKSFYYDAAPYDQSTPQSGFTSNDGNVPPYVYRWVSGSFIAYVDGGASLIVRCASAETEEAEDHAPFDKLLSASMFARRLD